LKNITNTHSYRWFNTVWNEGKRDLIPTFLAEKVIAYGLVSNGTSSEGPEGFFKFYDGFCQQYKNINVKLLEVIADETAESALCKVMAVHIHTETEVDFTGISMVKIHEGRITEAWNFFDFARLAQQIKTATEKSTVA